MDAYVTMKGGKSRKEREREEAQEQLDITTAPIIAAALPGSRSLDCEPEYRQKAIYAALEEDKKRRGY